MPTRTHRPTVDALLAELRELSADVLDDDRVRARRLAVLRRLERHLASDDIRHTVRTSSEMAGPPCARPLWPH